MAVEKVTASLNQPGSFSDWLEFDIGEATQFSIFVSNRYGGCLTLQVRDRGTGAIVDRKRFRSGEKVTFNGEVVSKQDLRLGFKDGDYRHGTADVSIHEEGK